MAPDKIHIDEENTHLLWGLISIVCIASATYILANAFMAGSWSIAGYTQIISLLLFSVGFYGIIRLTSPLFHFTLIVSDSTLSIEIWQGGEQPIDTLLIPLDSISELRIAPHTPRSPNEALFDFSTTYHLLYLPRGHQQFKRLIEIEDESFTLKVNDIGKIMQFLRQHHSQITVPNEQSIFLNL